MLCNICGYKKEVAFGCYGHEERTALIIEGYLPPDKYPFEKTVAYSCFPTSLIHFDELFKAKEGDIFPTRYSIHVSLSTLIGSGPDVWCVLGTQKKELVDDYCPNLIWTVVSWLEARMRLKDLI